MLAYTVSVSLARMFSLSAGALLQNSLSLRAEVEQMKGGQAHVVACVSLMQARYSQERMNTKDNTKQFNGFIRAILIQHT